MHNKKLILAYFFMHRMSFSFIMYLFVCHFNYANFVRLIALGKVVFFPPTYLVHCISTYTMQLMQSWETRGLPSSFCFFIHFFYLLKFQAPFVCSPVRRLDGRETTGRRGTPLPRWSVSESNIRPPPISVYAQRKRKLTSFE